MNYFFQLTMEQRLDAISIEKSRPKEPPVANNLALLLTQGLTSNDSKILNVRLRIVLVGLCVDK